MHRREFVRWMAYSTLYASITLENCTSQRAANIFPSSLPTHRLDVGRNILYNTFGDASKPPLLFLHGLGRSPLRYDLELLADSYFIIAPHIYGRLDGKQPKTLQEYADITAAFACRMRIKDAHIVGHSTGATVAWYGGVQEFASDIVSIDPILPIRYAKYGFAARGIAMNLHELFGIAGGRKGSQIARRDIALTLKAFLRHPRHAMDDEEDFSKDISAFRLETVKVSKPTLLLYGENDELFDLSGAEKSLHRSFSNIQIKKFPGEYHEWPMFHPKKAYAAVKEFHSDIAHILSQRLDP